MSTFTFQVHALIIFKTQRQIITVDARLRRANYGDGPLDRPT